MRASHFLLTTLREAPGDAVVTSHKLMLRAGLVRKQGSGLYHLMPLGLKSFRKIENIIREEMNASGALEFNLPILTPASLWQKSGRWDRMGKELFRLQDRHEEWNALGPTHEESFTDLMQGVLKSYRDLPINVYQIHTKFRDEIRPRFGVMRSREFVMKDAYSFDRDDQGLDATYQKMRKTYRSIFDRMNLETIPVEADTGTMGGSASEEFMVVSEIGEEVLMVSTSREYRGNREKTPVVYPDVLPQAKFGRASENLDALEKIATPNLKTISDVAKFLKVEPRKLLKNVLYRADKQLILVVMRADREVNEVKLSNVLGGMEFVPASEGDVRSIGSEPGFIGPIGLTDTRVLFDQSVLTETKWITGANQKDFHVRDFVLGFVETLDLALAVSGDLSPDGKGKLEEVKGIELGHIFKLGRKYTEAFGVTVLDEDGKGSTPTMGCYGIGLNRSMAAVIEQHNDEKGIIWPLVIAPFEFCLIGITKGEEEMAKLNEIYDEMVSKGLDVIFDDRDLRPGVKFADAELIGYPIRVTVGKTFFEKGSVEVVIRKGLEKREIAGNVTEIVGELRKIRESLLV